MLAKVYIVSFYEAAFCEQKLKTLPSLQTQLLGQSAPLPFFPCSPYLALQQAARLSRPAGAGLPASCEQFLQSRMWLAWKSTRALLKMKREDNMSWHFQSKRFDSFPGLLWLVLQTHRFSCPQAILTSSWVWNDLRRNKEPMRPFSFQVAIGQNLTVR